MTPTAGDTPTPGAERAFRALLGLYPSGFRERYGAEMVQLFRDRWGEPRFAGGRWERAGFWTHVLVDLARAAPRERVRALASTTTPNGRANRTSTGDAMDTLLQDTRYALRTLLKRPAFSAIAIITLALGIGANTAIFSVVSAVLLRPLPYPDPGRMLAVWESDNASKQQTVSYANYADWRRASKTLEEVAVIRGQSVNLTGGETPDRLIGSFVSASLFRTLGGRAERGRVFTEQESEVGSEQPVAVISHGLWTGRFGSDPAALGRTLTLNGRSYTVIGIMPASFQPPYGLPDVWLPMPYYPNAHGLERGNRSTLAIAKLRPGVSLASAQSELDAIAAHLAEQYPETNGGTGVNLVPLADQLVGDIRPALLIVLAAVAIVLLIACANVANLQLARATARRREISLRAALGAGRMRLVRQLLTESVILSVAGGALGLLLAHWGVRLLAANIPDSVPVFGAIGIDREVLGFAVTITLVTGFVFGLAPALQASRADLNESMKAGESRASAGLGGSRFALRNLFVVGQVALSIVLLIGAGLLTRSLTALRSVEPGFDAKNLLTMEFRLPAAKYPEKEQISTFFTRAIAEIRSVPGVRSAALVRAVPLSGNSDGTSYLVEGQPDPVSGKAPMSQRNTVSPGYFKTMGIPLLQGRDFTTSDDANAQSVVIINEELARRAWPGQSPMGKRFRSDKASPWLTVIGVVPSVKHLALGDQPTPQVYVPYMQFPQIFTSVVVRASADAQALSRPVREAIWKVDRDQPVWKMRTMEELMSGSLGQQRFTMALLAAFATVALALAGIGIYGVMSYTVAQRTREVGIRMALGARAGEVLRMVVRQGMTLILIAVAIGLVAATAATRVLSSQLYGVSAFDPATFIAVPIILAAVALLACYVPAKRASRVDPLVALRSEG